MQGGLVCLDGEQVVGVPLKHQVVGVAALGVQRVGGDHHIGQVLDLLHELGEHRNLVGRAVDVDLADHHPGAVIDRGQQMPGVGSVGGRASHRLAVDGQRPPPVGGRFGAPRSPGADGGVQLVAVQPL